ncbi:Eco47II family restriction endonuclease, partial [bacterium]|nr:Eco47II family restriction endonuclease [bacterium]
TFKLTFDSQFNYLSEKSIIETEILRQIDKSINGSRKNSNKIFIALKKIGITPA